MDAVPAASVARRGSLWGAVAYGAMLVGAVAFFVYISRVGEGLVGLPVSVAPAAARAAAPDVLWRLLLALTAVVVTGQALGSALKWIGQPPVIGQTIAGIALGPSLLGRISPEALHYVLPPEVAPYLGIVAQLGVVLYMFLVGVELNPDLLRGHMGATAWTSHASIVVPFILGSALSLFLYPRFSPSAVPFTHFALFMGIALSITAFPVLARILADKKMTTTKLGALALTCAAVDDVTAWCLLALVVGVVRADAASALVVAALTAGFIALMFIVVRPVIDRLARSSGDAEPSRALLATAFTAMLLSALTTEAIGVHAIFGAFLMGALIPHDSPLGRTLKQSIESLVTILILPAFFAFTGMRTEIGLVATGTQWAIVGLIILVATAGKFGGALTASRLSGLDWRHSAGLGVLMNTRGLMELIVLNVGLDLGVVSPTLFTMLVIMALVTTMATSPIIARLFPPGTLR